MPNANEHRELSNEHAIAWTSTERRGGKTMTSSRADELTRYRQSRVHTACPTADVCVDRYLQIGNDVPFIITNT